jgi:hypothetical protein
MFIAQVTEVSRNMATSKMYTVNRTYTKGSTTEPIYFSLHIHEYETIVFLSVPKAPNICKKCVYAEVQKRLT